MLKQPVIATALTCGAAVAYAQTPAPSPQSMRRSNTASAPATESTGDFNKTGDMAGSAIIGARVHDTSNKETVGSIENIYLDDSGKVKVVPRTSPSSGRTSSSARMAGRLRLPQA